MTLEIRYEKNGKQNSKEDKKKTQALIKLIISGQNMIYGITAQCSEGT